MQFLLPKSAANTVIHLAMPSFTDFFFLHFRRRLRLSPLFRRLRLPARVGGHLVPVDGAALHRHRRRRDERQGRLRRAGPRRREVHPKGVSRDRRRVGGEMNYCDPLPLHPLLSRQPSRVDQREKTIESPHKKLHFLLGQRRLPSLRRRPSVLRQSLPLSVSQSVFRRCRRRLLVLSESLAFPIALHLLLVLLFVIVSVIYAPEPRKCPDPSQSECTKGSVGGGKKGESESQLAEG